MSERGKYILNPKYAERYLLIDCQKVVIKEKGIEMLCMEVKNFVANFDKIVFIAKDGKKTTYIKEAEK